VLLDQTFRAISEGASPPVLSTLSTLTSDVLGQADQINPNPGCVTRDRVQVPVLVPVVPGVPVLEVLEVPVLRPVDVEAFRSMYQLRSPSTSIGLHAYRLSFVDMRGRRVEVECAPPWKGG